MLDWVKENDGKVSIKKLIPPAFRNGSFFKFKGRYRVFKGARNTGKSHTIIGWEPLLKIFDDERRNVLIVRMNNNSNRQSTLENLMGRIVDLGMEKLFRKKDGNLETSITYKPTGQKIVFKGLNDPTAINSITFAHGYLTDVYIEEAFEIESASDFRKLDGSLRHKLPKGLFLQITLCFNAWSKEHWIYEKFFKGRLEDDFEYLMSHDYQEYKNEDEFIDDGYGKGLYLHTSTYRCNIYRDTENYDRAMEVMRAKSLDIYKVEALGMWGNSTSTTYPEFNDTCIMDIQEILKKYTFATYALGIDTGLSNGEGGKRTVGRNQEVEERVKSATVLTLVGVTDDYENIVTLEEYYHTEIERNGEYNTDESGQIGAAELIKRCADYVCQWMHKYSYVTGGRIFGPRQMICIYVDNEDITFLQMLRKEFEMRNMYNVNLYQSTKMSVQNRVDFEKIMMAWGNFIVSSSCQNVIREFKNARRDPKGRARTDNDDHALTSLEYAFTPLLGDVHQWKKFKAR